MFGNILALVGVRPGRNEGVGNYMVDLEDPGSVCRFFCCSPAIPMVLILIGYRPV